MTRLRLALAWLAAFLLAGAPRAAEACSVCMSGRDDETRAAFLGTTVLLSILPLLLIGGIAWWVWRLARRQAAEAEAREPGPAVEAPRRHASA